MRLMAWFLLEAEYRVTVAPSIELAISRAQDNPNIIVFNSHLELPEKKEIVERLRGVAPGAAILDIRDQGKPVLESGADSYLSLPFDAYDLVAAVDALKP
jgi:DNA-binding response OmpR family regulator